jgi:hypothetical protein
MKKIVCIFCLCIAITVAPHEQAEASMFGEENATLIQILAQAIKQLYELQQILRTGQDSLNLMRDINRGINDSLNALDTLGRYMDPGTYKEFKKVENIVDHLRKLYGDVSPSPNKGVQADSDQVVAEAINVNNSLYDYAKDMDDVGEQIKNYSHAVSPGGAQKLTAQSMGVMIHIMDHQMRAQATGLKLQAQILAVQNKREKESTSEYLNQADQLSKAMSAKENIFEFPRF